RQVSEPADFQPGGGVPETGGLIEAAGGDPTPVGRDGDGPDFALMAAHLADFLARRDVPGADGALVAARDNRSAVRRERRLDEFTRAARPKSMDLRRPGGRVPEHDTVAGTSPAGQ